MAWDECMRFIHKIGNVFIFLAFLHLVSAFGTRSSSALGSNGKDAVVLLAKTRETFKLADLQYLEAVVQSESKYNCQRLLLDAATGSSLFVLDQLAADFETYIFGNTNSSSCHQDGLPSSLRFCEWIAEVLYQSPSAEELLIALSKSTTKLPMDTWTLDYVRMTSASTTSLTNKTEKRYTQKTICCCVSQKLPGTAALNPSHGVDQLLLVDTCESMFLVKLLQVPLHNFPTASSPITIMTQQKWAQRPFPYSSATNFQAAEMIMNLLAHRIVMRSVNESLSQSRLLDPTCGSGTFLALAMARGMQVTGWDSNIRCVEGTKQNLQYVFESMDSTVLHRSCLDIPEDLTLAGVEHIDAVACNLPWGLNSNLFTDDIEANNGSSRRLLSAIRNVLKPGIPCVFLLKDEDECTQDNSYWESLGYRLIGHASIPPKNFALPRRGKKEKKRSSENVLTGRSNCIISLVETI